MNLAQQQRTEAITTCHTQHQARAGAPSIAVELQAQGEVLSARTVGRIMQNLGLRAKTARVFPTEYMG